MSANSDFKKKNSQTVVFFDPAFKRALDAHCQRLGLSRATFIRDTIAKAIGRQSRIRGQSAR